MRNVGLVLLWVVAPWLTGYFLAVLAAMVRVLVAGTKLEGKFHFHLHGYYIVSPTVHLIGICLLLCALEILLWYSITTRVLA